MFTTLARRSALGLTWHSRPPDRAFIERLWAVLQPEIEVGLRGRDRPRPVTVGRKIEAWRSTTTSY